MSSINKLKDILESIREDMAVDFKPDNTVMHPSMRWLTDRNMRHAMFETSPECFLVIQNAYGEDIPFFPVCNREATSNPDVLKHMIGIAKDLLLNSADINPRSVRAVIVKLEELEELASNK